MNGVLIRPQILLRFHNKAWAALLAAKKLGLVFIHLFADLAGASHTSPKNIGKRVIESSVFPFFVGTIAFRDLEAFRIRWTRKTNCGIT